MPILLGHHREAVLSHRTILPTKGTTSKTWGGGIRWASPSDMAMNGYLSKDTEMALDYPKTAQLSCSQPRLSSPQLPHTKPGAFQAAPDASNTHSPLSQDSSPYSQCICSQTSCHQPRPTAPWSDLNPCHHKLGSQTGAQQPSHLPADHGKVLETYICDVAQCITRDGRSHTAPAESYHTRPSLPISGLHNMTNKDRKPKSLSSCVTQAMATTMRVHSLLPIPDTTTKGCNFNET